MDSYLIQDIISSVRGNVYLSVLRPFDYLREYRNQLVFFYKPEVFIPNESDRVDSIIRMVTHKLDEFGVVLSGGIVFSGKAMEDLGVMDRHYGFINKLSKNASAMASDAEKMKIGEALEINPSEYELYGGHEFLKAFPAFDPFSLSDLWLSKKSLKIRSGYYAQAYDVEGKKVILVNGFHPSQLAHFTDPEHRTVVFLAHSNLDWKALKDDFAGDTFPEKASPESIRGELYTQNAHYNAGTVSVNRNFVHLSAGPFEALFEMRNFLSGLGSLHYDARRPNLADQMSAAEMEHALGNPRAVINGKETDLFSATENTDTPAALEIFRTHFGA